MHTQFSSILAALRSFLSGGLRGRPYGPGSPFGGLMFIRLPRPYGPGRKDHHKGIGSSRYVPHSGAKQATRDYPGVLRAEDFVPRPSSATGKGFRRASARRATLLLGV